MLIHKGDDVEPGFVYHDLGYIQLAPCLPFESNVAVAHNAGDKVITSPDGRFALSMVGQYIYLGGWKKIHAVLSATSARLTEDATTTGMTISPVVTMNEISIDGANLNLSRFEIDYVPRTR